MCIRDRYYHVFEKNSKHLDSEKLEFPQDSSWHASHVRYFNRGYDGVHGMLVFKRSTKSELIYYSEYVINI